MEQPKLTPEQIAELQQYIGYGVAWLGPVLVEGSGCRVTDIEGKSYLDCTSQAWTLALGYNHPEVLEAAFAQAKALAHVRAGFPTIPRLLLAKRLADLCSSRRSTGWPPSPLTSRTTGSTSCGTMAGTAMSDPHAPLCLCREQTGASGRPERTARRRGARCRCLCNGSSPHSGAA